MGFEFNPSDEDPHGLCRHEIETLRTERIALAQELADVRGKLAAIRDRMKSIVVTSGVDKGVVLLDIRGTTHYDENLRCRVYDRKYFSPLGDALIEVFDLTE